MVGPGAEMFRTPARAAERYLDCLERRVALGDRSGSAEAFEGLASILAVGGIPSEAVTLLGQAEALRAETKAVALPAHEGEMEATRRTIAGMLSDDEARGIARAGADLELEEALARARTAVETVVAEFR